MFNPACTCTTQVSTYTLDQQEEMGTVLAVLRWRRSARNTNAYSPRHTLLSASTRSWLSMSTHQNRDTPPRHGVLSGEIRRHATQIWSFLCWKARRANPVFLKALRSAMRNGTRLFFQKKFVSFWCSCTADVKMHVRKKDSAMSCLIGGQKVFHPVCQTLKKQHHSDHRLQTRR